MKKENSRLNVLEVETAQQAPDLLAPPVGTRNFGI